MKKDRFITVYKQGRVNLVKVLLDTETGVHYLYTTNGYAGGLTVLLDEEGKPMVTAPVESNAVTDGLAACAAEEVAPRECAPTEEIPEEGTDDIPEED